MIFNNALPVGCR